MINVEKINKIDFAGLAFISLKFYLDLENLTFLFLASPITVQDL